MRFRSLLPLISAFGTGCLLTLMVLFNGQMAAAGTALLASWVAHGAGALAALAFLGGMALAGRKSRIWVKAPPWAYLGGAAGAVTVVLTSLTVNSALALSGTIALGLAGQVVFGLAADRFGLFGLARHQPSPRRLLAIGLVLAGSGVLIFLGRGP